MIFKLRRGGEAGEKWSGVSLQKREEGWKGDKSQSPAPKKPLKIIRLVIWEFHWDGFGSPAPSEGLSLKGLWGWGGGGCENRGMRGNASGWVEVGPWEGWLLRHFFWGQKSLSERAPDVNGRPWRCQPAQDGCTLWFRALSRARHSCLSWRKSGY